MARLNKINYHVRDIILKVENQKYIGGLVSFVNLDLERLEELIKNKFVKLDSRQNNSPTVQEFYEFMKNILIQKLMVMLKVMKMVEWQLKDCTIHRLIFQKIFN